MGADAAFGGVKEAEKGGGLLGDGVRVSLTVGERFRPQVESAEISCGNHCDRGLRKQEAPTPQSAKRTHLGGLDTQNRKTDWVRLLPNPPLTDKSWDYAKSKRWCQEDSPDYSSWSDYWRSGLTQQ